MGPVGEMGPPGPAGLKVISKNAQMESPFLHCLLMVALRVLLIKKLVGIARMVIPGPRKQTSCMYHV